jgi:hypothetical protein
MAIIELLESSSSTTSSPAKLSWEQQTPPLSQTCIPSETLRSLSENRLRPKQLTASSSNLAEKPLARLGAKRNLGFVLNKEKKYAEAEAVLRDLGKLIREVWGV